MAAILSLIGGVKGMIVIAVMLALGTYIGVLHHKASAAEAARDQAITQRDQTAVERDKAITAAKANEETITNLQHEKDLINQALNSLQANQAQNRQSAQTRDQSIQAQAGVPANAAPAAPVLGQLVYDIQMDRYARRGISVPVAAAASATRKGINQ